MIESSGSIHFNQMISLADRWHIIPFIARLPVYHSIWTSKLNSTVLFGVAKVLNSMYLDLYFLCQNPLTAKGLWKEICIKLLRYIRYSYILFSRSIQLLVYKSCFIVWPAWTTVLTMPAFMVYRSLTSLTITTYCRVICIILKQKHNLLLPLL